MGAVLHTLNLRLYPQVIGYIADHAVDDDVIINRFGGRAGKRNARKDVSAPQPDPTHPRTAPAPSPAGRGKGRRRPGPSR